MKEYKSVKYPEDGTQFIAVWEQDKKLWGGAHKVIDGVLYEYIPDKDEFVESPPISHLKSLKVFVYE